MPIESINELIAWSPGNQNAIISDGILLPETGILVFGGAKAWKSIFSLHTGNCLVTGESWFGFKVQKCCCLKFQTELPKAIDRSRVIKYMNSHRPADYYFKTSPYFKLDTGYGKIQLEREIQEAQARSPGLHLVVILDPVYLLISGHISDDYDIKKLLDNCNELKAKHHCSMILIHHTHKTRVDSAGNIIDLGSEEIMGSSYFNNWADTMIRLKLLNPFGQKNKVELSFPLSRHAEGILPTIQIEWSRNNLHPTVLSRTQPELEEVTVRGLK